MGNTASRAKVGGFWDTQILLSVALLLIKSFKKYELLIAVRSACPHYGNKSTAVRAQELHHVRPQVRDK